MTDIAAAKTPLSNTISEAKLERIVSDASYAKLQRGDDASLSRFSCNHSMSIIVDSKGKQDLLFDGRGDHVRGNAARLIQHWSPSMAEELIRGYRLARAAGLLGDDRCNEAAAIYLCPPAMRGNDTLSIAAGKKQMAGLVEVLRAENRKPGGIKVS